MAQIGSKTEWFCSSIGEKQIDFVQEDNCQRMKPLIDHLISLWHDYIVFASDSCPIFWLKEQPAVSPKSKHNERCLNLQKEDS